MIPAGLYTHHGSRGWPAACAAGLLPAWCSFTNAPLAGAPGTRGARGSERAFGWSGSCRPPPSHSSTQEGPALHVVKPGNAVTGRVVRIGGCSQPSAVCIPASNKRLAPIVHTAAVRPWGISATVGRLCSAVLVQRISRIRRGPPITRGPERRRDDRQWYRTTANLLPVPTRGVRTHARWRRSCSRTHTRTKKHLQQN